MVPVPLKSPKLIPPEPVIGALMVKTPSDVQKNPWAGSPVVRVGLGAMFRLPEPAALIVSMFLAAVPDAGAWTKPAIDSLLLTVTVYAPVPKNLAKLPGTQLPVAAVPPATVAQFGSSQE